MPNSDPRCNCCGIPITAIRSTKKFCDEHCRLWAHRHPGEVPSWAPAVHEEATIKEANRIKLARKKAKSATRQADIAERAAGVASINAQMRYQILNVSCADFPSAARSCGMVDWVVTDPPYPREYLSVYSDLSLAAKRMLKPGGLLACMDGGFFTDEVKQRLREHLTFHDTMIYELGGQAANRYSKRINVGYKPILLYSNGPYTGPWINNLCKSKANDKEHHHWGQSESGMLDIIRQLHVEPGDWVVDPFIGGGTTGVAALLSGAWFIGGDIDQKWVDATKDRLSKLAAEINASNKAA
jgi:hypothetical protein